MEARAASRNTSNQSHHLSSSPHLRQFVSSLIASIPHLASPSANPLKHLSPPIREKLLTLHALFPNELLPALDVLDRGLVTRLQVTASDHVDATNSGRQRRKKNQSHDHDDNLSPSYFLVRSAAQQQISQRNNHARSSDQHSTQYYEVRLNAWTCSCPGFAFAAFPAATATATATALGESAIELPPPLRHVGSPKLNSTSSTFMSGMNVNCFFGGVTRGSDLPVCKHLLACVLAEHCQMMAHLVEERAVSVEEMAGWAAGWGD